MQELENSNIELRNYGIDLLRILAPIMVIIMHLLYYGGLRQASIPFTPSYQMLWLLGIGASCSVNCFAMISGYVSYGKKFKVSNILRLYLIVLLYSKGITDLVSLTYPQGVRPDDIMATYFPVIMNTYWYFTAYLVICFGSPLLNRLVQKLSKKQEQCLITVAFFLFSVLPTVFQKDYFAINRGYGLPWMAYVYFIGAYLKKHREELKYKKHSLLLMYAGSVGITWLAKWRLEAWSMGTYNTVMDFSMVLDYCSPTILFSAIALVLLFSSAELSRRAVRVVAWFAPLSFSVYIIHEHPLVRRLLISQRMLPVLELPLLLQLPAVILCAVAVFLVCSGMDWIRKCIFDYFGIEKLLQKADLLLIARRRREAGEPRE